jgi:hypothetical protein
MRLRFALALVMSLALTASARARVQPPDAIASLVARLEQAGAAGDTAAILALAAAGVSRDGIEDFAKAVSTPRPERLVIKERDRSLLDDSITQRLLLEVFFEQTSQGFVSTWRLDVRPGPGGADAGWRIAGMQRLSYVSGLYRLSLNPTKQFDIQHLTVRGPDLTLEIASGTAFVAETPDGPTAIVLMGRGVLRFAPHDAAERTQLRIFGGNDVLTAEFDAAFIRVRPFEFGSHFLAESLAPRPVSAGDLRRATSVFDEYVGRTFQIDLSDLSRDRWSLPPSPGDLVAEVRTRRFGSLTYARSSGDPEDVSFFDRKRRRNISVYASEEKLASRGRFFSEDELIDYDVLAYDLDATFVPERSWIDGNARVKVKIRVPGTTTLTFRLADTLTVRGVFSPAFGRLLHLRVVGQNSVIVNLPEPVMRGDEVWLNVTYSGRLEPQQLQNEAIALDAQAEQFVLPPEPRFIYSNRNYWYPQSTVTDYATAKLRITVPADYDVVASGDPAGAPAPPPGVVDPAQRARKVFVFEADRPVRYLACVISRFNAVDSARLNVPTAGNPPGEAGPPQARGPAALSARDAGALSLFVQANPRQSSRGRALSERAATIFQYYVSLVGEAPYPSFTLALTESDAPGGHSPAYFAVLNQAVPTSAFVWRNDPVVFDHYPSFFLAHEIAHQWWGQAVGWKNYHEQWISEGFAQYFAALYALEERGDGVFEGIMRQMRDTAISASRQGPVYLGYRLGHIKGDTRVFRAVIYNKGAVVLQMLRRLVGDEAFFAGLRQFYAEWRFKKAGTDDFRSCMEKASGRDLARFFESWIYTAEIPRVRFSSRVNGDGTLLVRFEHRGEVADLPVTVKVTYVTGDTDKVVVPVSERVVERTIRLKAGLRSVDVNQDGAALAIIEK